MATRSLAGKYVSFCIIHNSSVIFGLCEDIESPRTLENLFPRFLPQNNYQKSSKIFRQKKD